MLDETCELCAGDLVLMGSLGTLVWARCRACGWQQTVTPGELHGETPVEEDADA